MNPIYRQLWFGIFLVIFILGGGFVYGSDKEKISIALSEEFESRSGTPEFKLIEQLKEIHSKFHEKLRKSKIAEVIVKLVPMKEIATADENKFPDVSQEAKTYVKIARKNRTLAVVKGFYALTEDLFVLTFRVCDAKTGSFFAISTSTKSSQGKIQIETVNQKLDGICQEIVERIIYYNNLKNQ